MLETVEIGKVGICWKYCNLQKTVDSGHMQISENLDLQNRSFFKDW